MNKALLILLSILITGCASNKNLVKTVNKKLETDFFKNHFTGFFVYNPKSGDTIFNYNGEKYFTPASNAKIITLYTAYTLLPKNLPTLKYVVSNENIYIEGLGNPATLHPYLKDSSLIKFLKNQNNIKLYYNNIEDHPYAPGWAWDDFDAYYAPERNSFPLYGNVAVFNLDQVDSLYVAPAIFKDSLTIAKTTYRRSMKNNHFFMDPKKKDTLKIPFITDSITTKEILEHIIHKPISIVNSFPEGEKTTLYGIKADTIYKRMMHLSDNFLAEQLLILSSSVLGDTLSSRKARNYILNNELSGIRHNPRWVDGSGLSRYNLFTPQSIVFVLDKLYKEMPTEMLFDIFPTGGKTGTLKNFFKGNPKPYLHAKTGTLSNNYCLSGYLETKSGEILIFSFMNNHYRGGSSEVKKHMTPLLEWIRDHY